VRAAGLGPEAPRRLEDHTALDVTPDLSICIVNWNTRSDLEQALFSILQAGSDLSMEVIVFDNASSDGSPERVEQLFLA